MPEFHTSPLQTWPVTRHLAAMLILAILTVSVCATPPPGPDCFDALMLVWNTFASDANRYIQTVESKAEKRDQARARLRREWEAVLRCECF